MLKKKVDTLDGIENKYHILYTKQEDGTFILDSNVVGDGDTSGLKENSEKLKAEKLAIQAKLDALEADSKAKEEDELGAKGEYEKLLKLKQEEFDTKITNAETEKAKAVEQIKNTMARAELLKIANEMAGDNAELILPHITSRVQVNVIDGNYTVQYTDINGTPVSTDPSMLKEDIKKNPLFKNILKGRSSNGGGAGGGSGGNGSTGDWDKYFDPSSKDYNPDKQGDLETSDNDQYKALVKKFDLDNPYLQVKTAS
jgi:hypothetical protein